LLLIFRVISGVIFRTADTWTKDDEAMMCLIDMVGRVSPAAGLEAENFPGALGTDAPYRRFHKFAREPIGAVQDATGFLRAFQNLPAAVDPMPK